MLRRYSTLFACALLVGCGSVDDERGNDPTGEGDDPIIGGATDNGDPSVVALFAHQAGATSGSLCRATLPPRSVVSR